MLSRSYSRYLLQAGIVIAASLGIWSWCVFALKHMVIGFEFNLMYLIGTLLPTVNGIPTWATVDGVPSGLQCFCISLIGLFCMIWGGLGLAKFGWILFGIVGAGSYEAYRKHVLDEQEQSEQQQANTRAIEQSRFGQLVNIAPVVDRLLVQSEKGLHTVEPGSIAIVGMRVVWRDEAHLYIGTDYTDPAPLKLKLA